MKSIKAACIGFIVGIIVASSYFSFSHIHHWTKWERRTAEVTFYRGTWTGTEILGEGIVLKEYRSCTLCGKYQEHKVN